MSKQKLNLKLYVTGNSPNSCIALHNITGLLDRYLANRYELEVIDLFDHPLRAIEDDIMMTPTLVVACVPPVLVVGDLSNPAPVLQALKIVPDDS